MNQYETINHTYEHLPILKSSGRPWQSVDCSGTDFAAVRCRDNENPTNDCLAVGCECKLVGGAECGINERRNLHCEPQGAIWDSYYWEDIANNQGVCQ